MQRTKLHLFTLFAVLLTIPVSADHLGTVHLLPVAGHNSGAFGTFWQTDLAAFNPNASPITLEILLVEAGEGRTDNITSLDARDGESLTIPARSSLRIPDVLGDRDGLPEVTGALIIGAELPFTITSRTFTTDDSGGTFGSTVPTALEFVNQPGEVLAVPALSGADAGRSNIGLVAVSDDGTDLVLEVTLLTSDGAPLGSRSVTVPAGGITQLQFSTTVISSGPFDPGVAEIVIVSGSGAVNGYGSVVDNITGDAVFVTGVSTSAASETTAAEQLSKFFRGERQ